MTLLSRMSLSRKLPAAIAGLCLSASLAVALVSYLDFRNNILEEAEESFFVIAESRGRTLEAWFDNLSQEVVNYAANPLFTEAVGAFSSSYNLLIDADGLQAAYIDNNPNPLGERHLLEQPDGEIPYHFQHARLHPYLTTVWEREGYYDLFLFNMEGDLVYSVAKESDFATNLVNGPYRESGLGQVFRAARDGRAGQSYFADFAPYAPSADAPAAFLASPIAGEDGSVVGVVAVQAPADQLNAVMTNPIGLGETGEIYAVGPDGLTRTGSRFAGGFAPLTDVSDVPSATKLGTSGAFVADIEGLQGAPVLAKSLQVSMLGVPWVVVAEMTMAEVKAPVIAVRNKMILLAICVGLISTLLGWLIARSVVGPLGRFGTAMQDIADKNYEVTLAEAKRADEIGDISKILMGFRDKLQASDAAERERAAAQEEQDKVVSRLGTALSSLADGDLTQRITQPFAADYEALRKNYNSTLDNLNTTIGALVQHADAVGNRADEMAAASDDLSRRTENQAATLEETAAALDELTSSVKSAATGAREVEDVARNARKDAEASEPVVKNAVTAMTEIEASSDQISQIIGVIDDIAFQTNLLALNAGVEAARAGEAGRGFAVVASEVRALAQRSSDAAKQIKGLISESTEQVGRGVNLVGEAGEVLTRIAGHINHISDLVGNIASGAEEQSTGLGEINIGVTQLDQVTQQNAAMVEEVTASSHALNGDATELTELVTKFRLDKNAKTAARPAVRVANDGTETSAPPASPVPVPAASGNAAHDMWQDF
ncbi:MAG: methyl-accepting chemotaxis protein [Pseudomonadota bacterium]